MSHQNTSRDQDLVKITVRIFSEDHERLLAFFPDGYNEPLRDVIHRWLAKYEDKLVNDSR